jgi:hypothetical protein
MSEVMDHKTWLWRKKSADKIVVATDHKVDLSSNEEEVNFSNSGSFSFVY